MIIKTITVVVEEEGEAINLNSASSDDEKSKFFIIIPAIVVGLLVIMVGLILIKCFTKKRMSDSVKVKKTMEDVNGPETEGVAQHDVQYILNPDDQLNIFGMDASARPQSVSSGQKSSGRESRRQRINVKGKKSKNQKDNVVVAIHPASPKSPNESIDDGFRQFSMQNTTKKFDLSSQSMVNAPVQTNQGSDTIRVLNDGLPSLRDEIDEDQ